MSKGQAACLEWRKDRKLTQVQVAKLLEVVSEWDVSRMENGKAPGSLPVIAAYARLMDIPAEDWLPKEE